MIAWYVKRINVGKMTIDQVPALWNDEVRKALGEG